MKNRELQLIKKDLKVVISNKLNSSQSKLLLIGIIFEIIQRRDLFPRNADLKKFIQQVILDPIENAKPFKDYIFFSRPLLGSKVSKIILFDFDYNNVIKTVEKLSVILPSDIDEKPQSSSNKVTDEDMNEWINFIRGNAN
ncbi:hypothetical protein AABM27_16600 [Heyndrickxia faecalis]|jgi:hypothetical protein|uniref:hypothetical protein n=1 Tax=Heyndrickxia TaxID=2837504 RepID=UPI000779CC33|nr:hypothetical protein [Heyndrickxia coagulans]